MGGVRDRKRVSRPLVAASASEWMTFAVRTPLAGTHYHTVDGGVHHDTYLGIQQPSRGNEMIARYTFKIPSQPFLYAGRLMKGAASGAFFAFILA